MALSASAVEEVEGREAVEEGEGSENEIMLPFEVATEDSRNVLSLTQEMEHLLDPLNKLRTPPPSIDLSPLECHALQTEEVETLTAIYGNDLRTLNDRGTCFLVNVRFLSQEIKEDDIIRIWFSLPASYPSVPPVFEIEANSSGSFSYIDADDLFDLLMREAADRVGNMMIFDLVTIAQEYMPGLIERKREAAERREVEERERKERLQLEEAFEDRKKTTSVPTDVWDVEEQPKEEEEEEEEEEEGFPAGSSTRRTGRRLIGATTGDDITFQPAHFVGSISDILRKFPDGLQILRIENVLRQDLAKRFHHCQQRMTSALAESERRNPRMYNLKTQVAFHGTPTRSLPSIVERGLVIPGSGNSVKVRCGSSLGVGIYLSPSPAFSLSFTDSNRLIVCAALLGRVYQLGSIMTGRFQSSFNSLVCGEEWVFFNASQVLPCYVVEVRQGTRRSLESHPPPLSSLLNTSSSGSRDEESAEQRRARLAARARKFLPYGFGPGAQTVILEVGSVDEDEEDYGDYQLLRSSQGQEVDHTGGGYGVVKKSSELQEYRYTTPTKKT